MVLVKNWLFFLFFMRGKTHQENVFDNILESMRKKKRSFPTSNYKNKKLKKWKKWDFSKGVSPWFYSKIGNFSIFLF